MTGRGPITTPERPVASDVQSSLTLVDFFQAWHQFRWWFLGGFLLVSLGTIIWCKVFTTIYYRAETKFFVGRVIPLEQRVGLADVEGVPVGRNEQYQNLVQGVLAEQYLSSSDLLLEVARRFASGEFAEKYGMQQWNLYELLDIEAKSEDRRQRMLAEVLKTNLIKSRQVQNTGLVILSVELPNPLASSQFANACVKVLMERFEALDFGYLDAAHKLYRDKLAAVVKEGEQLAEAKVADGLQYDAYPLKAQRHEKLKEQLKVQAEWAAAVQDKVSKLALATSPEARLAGQPVKIVEYGRVPLKKSRPKTILNTLMASSLYTFVFMLALVVHGYVAWGARQRREWPEA